MNTPEGDPFMGDENAAKLFADRPDESPYSRFITLISAFEYFDATAQDREHSGLPTQLTDITHLDTTPEMQPTGTENPQAA